MMRNLKALGLGLVAVLAMSGVVASTASGDDLTSEKTPVTLTGKQTGGGDVLTATAGTLKCKEVAYTATNLATPTTTIDVAPSYPLKTAGGEHNCTGFGFPGEILTNGCTYKVTIGAATVGGLDIICPAGQEITMISKAAGVTKCTIHFPAQNIATGTTYSNTGSGTTREINITANLAGTLAYKHTAGSGIGACTTGSGSGSYTGAAIAIGESSGSHVGIFLS